MEDLFEAKQALTAMVIDGKSIEEIEKLNDDGFFGNLDIYEVLHEMDQADDYASREN
jgi:hypothetical protein